LNSAALPSITGAEIAQPQHRRPVADHRDEVALRGVVVGQRRIAVDVQAGFRHAGAVGQREIARGGQRLGEADLELAGPAFPMHRQRFLAGDARGAGVADALREGLARVVHRS
jgi:hypothetical protein